MFSKLGDKIISEILNLLKLIQFILIFLSYAMLIFVICIIAKVEMSSQVIYFFDLLSNLGGIFFEKNIVIGNQDIKITYVITIILFLFLSYCINELVGNINIWKIKKEIIDAKHQKKQEKSVNKKLQKELVLEECKNNKFIVMFDFKVLTQKQSWGEEKTVTPKDVQHDFFGFLEGNINCDFEFIEKKLLLKFDDISKIDRVLDSLHLLLEKIRNNYKKQELDINWVAVVDVLKDESELSLKAYYLKKILGISFPNKMMCYSTFKTRYELCLNRTYKLISNGCYYIDNNVELFSLEKK